jgi:hypothetical protein
MMIARWRSVLYLVTTKLGLAALQLRGLSVVGAAHVDQLTGCTGQRGPDA